MFSSDSSALDGTAAEYTATLRYALVAFTTLAWYNAVEMLFLIFVVFKKYKGLYFWSMVITTISIVPYQIGAWLKLVYRTYNVLATVFLNTGWIFMIIGQSVVLYSRLHLVTQNPMLLGSIRWMIVGTAICMCIPTTVATYGSNLQKTPSFITAYNVIEKIQMTSFTIQEFIISITYLVRVYSILKIASHKRTRRILYELLVINIIIIISDIVLLAMEYLNAYQVEIVLKGFIYSVKLKLELGVLSKLVRTVSGRQFQNGILARVGENFTLDGDKFHLGILAAHIQGPNYKTSHVDTSDWRGSAQERERKGSNAIVSPRVATVCADMQGRRPSAAAHRGMRSLSSSRDRGGSVQTEWDPTDRIADIPEHASVDPEGPSAVLDECDSMIPWTTRRQEPCRNSSWRNPFGSNDAEYPGRL